MRIKIRKERAMIWGRSEEKKEIMAARKRAGARSLAEE